MQLWNRRQRMWRPTRICRWGWRSRSQCNLSFERRPCLPCGRDVRHFVFPRLWRILSIWVIWSFFLCRWEWVSRFTWIEWDHNSQAVQSFLPYERRCHKHWRASDSDWQSSGADESDREAGTGGLSAEFAEFHSVRRDSLSERSAERAESDHSGEYAAVSEYPATELYRVESVAAAECTGEQSARFSAKRAQCESAVLAEWNDAEQHDAKSERGEHRASAKSTASSSAVRR